MAVSVEEVSSSLVREYLSRKGLKRTIACMDEEHPRTEASINNRSLLRQILNIEDLYRKNKIQNSPLKTLLEIIVKYHIRARGMDSAANEGSDLMQPSKAASPVDKSPIVVNEANTEENLSSFIVSQQSTLRSNVKTCQNPLDVQPYDSEYKRGQPLFSSLQDKQSIIQRDTETRTSTPESTHKSKNNRIRRGMMAGPVASTPQDLTKKRQQRKQMPQLILRKAADYNHLGNGPAGASLHKKGLGSDLCENSPDSVIWHQESVPGRLQRDNSFENMVQDMLEAKKVEASSRTTVADLNMSEMVLDDIDDDDKMQELSTVSFQRTIKEDGSASCPMDLHTAVELKDVLLGSSLNCFNVEWRNQSFTFSETHELRYGIVQKKGGPCGVLASVQAFVLKKLLFENSKSSDTGLQRLRPSNTTRGQCLVSVLAEILWRAGEEKQAKIAVNSGRNHFTPFGNYKSEGVLEKITYFTADNFKDLHSLLEQHIEQYETGQLGCILLTISAVLSRSVEKLKEDMDVPTTTLIGAHGYCTQELVNLLLCGRAVSNVFDNDMKLDSGNGNITLLKGVKGNCDVGLLSLFEHYNICKVGAFLKTPRYPIWVVCSESHFSVLFGLQRELLTYEDKGSEFDLYYYDGLANQHEEIRLTVSIGDFALSSNDIDNDLIPPLELCIRTRWKDAHVNWNDTDPIL